MSTHPRVVPEFPKRGLVGASMALGAVTAFYLRHAAPWTFQKVMDLASSGSGAVLRYGFLPLLVPAGLLLLLPVLVVVVAICRCEQGYKRVLALGGVSGAVTGLALLIAFNASQPDRNWMGSDWLSFIVEQLVETGLAGGVGASIGILLALSCRFAVRLTGRTLLVQTGTLCWKCGYDLGPPPVRCCPECATDANPDHFRSMGLIGAIHLVVSRGKVLGVLTGALLLSAILWIAICQRLPRHRFLKAVGPDTRIGILMRHPRPGEGVPLVVWRSGSPGLTPGVAIEGEWDVLGRVRRVRLMVAEAPVQTTSWCQPGAPVVQVFLNTEQSRDVLDHGLPQRLIDALLARAAAVGWAPTSTNRWSGEPVEPPDALDPQTYFKSSTP